MSPDTTLTILVTVPLLVPRVDPFRRVSDEEVFLPLEAGILLENGDADLLGSTRIDRGFVHYGSTTLEVATDALGRLNQRREIWLMRVVHRGGNRDDDEIRLADYLWGRYCR